MSIRILFKLAISSTLAPSLQTLPYLARLIITGDALRFPSLRRFFFLLPSPLLTSPLTAGLLHLPPSPPLSPSPLPLPSLPDPFPNLKAWVRLRALCHQQPPLCLFPPRPHARLLCFLRLLSRALGCRVLGHNGERYVKIGVMDVARKMFDEMSVKDEVSWSTMIGRYACYGEMDVLRGDGRCMLPAMGRWMCYGEMDDACCLFERTPTVGKSVVTWNSMVMRFARCGMLDTARRYFDEMPESNLVSWNVGVWNGG